MYYTNNGIDLYQGDMIAGDREATQAEILTYDNARIAPDKWKLVDDYMATLEVTSDLSVGGNKFNVSPQGIINIQNAMRGMVSGDTKRWVEDWDPFNTNLVEMEWVLKETERLRDLKIIEVGL